MQISGTTVMLGLIGTPVAHSKSPQMNNYCFQKYGLDDAYLAFDITPDQTERAVKAIRTLHMRGANATMPCKAAVIPYLDEITPAAKAGGAVNTIVNEGGKLTGHNTDGCGYTQNLRRNGVEVAGKKIVLLGGGAGSAIAVQAALAAAIAEADILSNATRVGMAPLENETNVEPCWYRPELVVTDVVYAPPQTRMLREAQAAGCRTCDGLGLLLCQGAEAFRLYTGLQMPVDEIRALLYGA